jgi:hypothetical protein
MKLGLEASAMALFWKAMREALYEETMTVPKPKPRRCAPKLSPGEIWEIKARALAGEKQDALALEFRVSPAMVSRYARAARAAA